MSTRGFFGFRFCGRDLFTYNHDDSYPTHLGRIVTEGIEEAVTNNRLPEMIRKLEAVIIPSEMPTAAEIKRCIDLGLYDARVVPDLTLEQDVEHIWYALLRKAQPATSRSIWSYLEAGFLPRIDVHKWIGLQYGYCIDLDAMTFEFCMRAEDDESGEWGWRLYDATPVDRIDCQGPSSKYHGTKSTWRWVPELP